MDRAERVLTDTGILSAQAESAISNVRLGGMQFLRLIDTHCGWPVGSEQTEAENHVRAAVFWASEAIRLADAQEAVESQAPMTRPGFWCPMHCGRWFASQEDLREHLAELGACAPVSVEAVRRPEQPLRDNTIP